MSSELIEKDKKARRELRRAIYRALLYPALVMTVAIVALGISVAHIVPLLRDMWAQLSPH